MRMYIYIYTYYIYIYIRICLYIYMYVNTPQWAAYCWPHGVLESWNTCSLPCRYPWSGLICRPNTVQYGLQTRSVQMLNEGSYLRGILGVLTLMGVFNIETLNGGYSIFGVRPCLNCIAAFRRVDRLATTREKRRVGCGSQTWHLATSRLNM